MSLFSEKYHQIQLGFESLPCLQRNLLLAGIMTFLLVIVGFSQSWNLAFSLLNMCLISAIMALGVNIQWGFAGLFNAGVMGFAALGGLAAVLISVDPVEAAWAVGGQALLFGFSIGVLTTYSAILIWKRLRNAGLKRFWITILLLVFGFAATRFFTDPATLAIEAVDPAKSVYLGGLGMPIMFSWIFGGLLA